MTQTAAETTAASQNGQPAPAPGGGGEPPCDDCVATSERVMGVLGLLFAVALAAVAVDLLSGGALSRAAGLGAPREGDRDGAGA